MPAPDMYRCNEPRKAAYGRSELVRAAWVERYAFDFIKESPELSVV